MPPGNTIIWIVLVVFFLFWLLFLLAFARIFRLWLQAFVSGAQVSFPEIFLMRLRRAPADQIVQARIMATQAGLNIPLSKIESAALLGVDIERAVLALIRAKEVGMEVTWEEVIHKDVEDRL